MLEQIAGSGGRCGRSLGAGISIRTRPVPHHMSQWDIGEGEPDHREEQHGGELDALGERPHDKAAGDGSKGPLEHHIDQLADPDPLAEGGGDGVRGYTLEQHLAEGAVEIAPLGKGQRIAVDHPEHTDEAEQGKDLHQHAQHVFGPYQTTVEEGQTGDRHQDHQRRREQHPGVVTLVDCHGGNRRHRSLYLSDLFGPTWGNQQGRQHRQTRHHPFFDHRALSFPVVPVQDRLRFPD